MKLKVQLHQPPRLARTRKRVRNSVLRRDLSQPHQKTVQRAHSEGEGRVDHFHQPFLRQLPQV